MPSIICSFSLPRRFLCPWHSPGKNTGVGSHSLLHGIFPTPGSNPSILHCRQADFPLPRRHHVLTWTPEHTFGSACRSLQVIIASKRHSQPSRCSDMDVLQCSSRDWSCLQARPQHTLCIEIAMCLFLQLPCDLVEGNNHALDCCIPLDQIPRAAGHQQLISFKSSINNGADFPQKKKKGCSRPGAQSQT